ncbi:MAG: hypothetical protein DWI61_00610 [Chloroflexi bacterium]|nr:MAG: hypothetical protein DWI61_00610 [Chloroflexota bacterium]
MRRKPARQLHGHRLHTAPATHLGEQAQKKSHSYCGVAAQSSAADERSALNRIMILADQPISAAY